MQGHLTVKNGLLLLPGPSGERFVKLFERGSLSVELYAPRGVDPQKPHTRDELYVVMSGRGRFFVSGEEEPFGPGDVLFAPAGAEHRFVDFDDSLTVWVIFYGSEGSELPVPDYGDEAAINDTK
ncbi:MAG TPA: cupin domain-containing protein [Terriglobales bacterium]|jgi:hypothetical protein|nr:cupin domain-containing protein [Terriglobales bacterium]